LEELKDKYLELYDFAPVGYVTLNKKGLILEANLTAVRLLGVERQSLIKAFFSRFVCKEFGDAFYFHLQRVFETQSKQTCEIKLAREDGTQIYAQLESIAAQDESGQFSRCRTIVSDITESKRAENLRDSEARLWDLYDNAPNAYFSVGTDGLIKKCNKSAEELLGYPREMLEGKRVFDLYMDGPEGKERATKVFQKFISGEQVTGDELQMKKADGSPIWISLSLNAREDADGKVVESRSAVVDITKRKRAEEALRASEEKYRAVFDNAGIGIDLLDRDGRVLRMNQSLLDTLGYAEEEVYALTFADITHPDDREISKRKLDSLMAGEIDSYRIEKRYLRKDGTIVWGDL